nr:hypothetical protein [uncultured Mucilaginibacter sp.]
MKSTFCIAVLLSIAVSSQLSAQVKKPIAKPGAKTVAKPVSKTVLNRIDFLGKDADDAVQILSDEFKKLKVDLNNLDEETLPSFNPVTHEKDPGNAEVEKSLEFGGRLTAYVTAPKTNIVNKISFSVKNLKHYNAIKAMLGVGSLTTISEGYSDTLYRNGDIFTTLSSMEDLDSNEDEPGLIYYISTERVAHSNTQLPAATQDFDINNIDIHSNYVDVTNAALNFVNKLGYSFYYKKLSGHTLDENNQLASTNYSTYFNRNVTVDFELNKLWLLSNITFTAPDPIAFSKLKKAFDLSAWTKTGTGRDVSNYFSKNIECVISNINHYIYFKISPSLTDLDTRLALAPTPNFSDLLAHRNVGTEEEVAKMLTKKYLTKVKYDDKAKQYVFDSKADDFEFYYMTPAGKTVRVLLKVNLTTEWTAPFIVYSFDNAYLQSLSAQFDSVDDYKKIYDKVIKENQFVIYDRKMEATRAANAAEQKRAEAERVAAREERERQAELERQRAKAAKDAQFNENLRKATEIMQKMLKQ